MKWEIVSFEGVGPIRFGMSVAEVSAVTGDAERTRRGLRQGSYNEFRGTKAPIVRYRDDRVQEIEAFYDLENVIFRGIDLFKLNGRETLRKLEELNGSARISVGIILFDQLGLTTGRLDEGPRTGHSVTAFAPGVWDEKMDRFEKISFL